MTTLGPIGLASAHPYTDDSAVVADEAGMRNDCVSPRCGGPAICRCSKPRANASKRGPGAARIRAPVVLRILGVEDLVAWRTRLADKLIG